jgi:hypothetical protein
MSFRYDFKDVDGWPAPTMTGRGPADWSCEPRVPPGSSKRPDVRALKNPTIFQALERLLIDALPSTPDGYANSNVHFREEFRTPRGVRISSRYRNDGSRAGAVANLPFRTP